MMKKMMSRLTRQILLSLLVIDVLIAIVSILFFDTQILYNTQFGFISASLVMLASMKSYQRMVDARVEHGVITIDDSKDVIDQLEDPYDLYSEEVIEEDKELVEVVKEERKKLKDGRSLGQILKDTKAALSLYRLGAYAILILGFLYLNRHELLHIPSYILALSVPMLIVVFILVSNKENTTSNTKVK